MQLTYRGIQYNVTPTSIRTVSTPLTATYRGASYSILKSDAVAPVPSQNLKYRGITIGAPETSRCSVCDTAMA